MEENILVGNFIEQYGIISIFVIVMLEYANFPLPSEVVLPFIGIMVAKGNINFWIAIIVSILAGIVGSMINYLIGLYLGKPVIKYILNKYPKTDKSVKSSMWWLKRYGKVSVMVARMVPLARTFISIPAGIAKMNISIFILYSSIGIGLWNVFLISLGYILGDNLSEIAYVIKEYTIVIGLILLVGMGIYYIRKRKSIHKK